MPDPWHHSVTLKTPDFRHTRDSRLVQNCTPRDQPAQASRTPARRRLPTSGCTHYRSVPAELRFAEERAFEGLDPPRLHILNDPRCGLATGGTFYRSMSHQPCILRD